MNELKFFFNGTNGTAVDGLIPVRAILSSKAAPEAIGTLFFRFEDNYFDASACSYNHNLAKMSLGMSMSAFTFTVGGDRYIRALLHTIGCDDRTVVTSKFDSTEAFDDSCGYAFAAKKLNNGYHLISVTIRSHRYGGEWVSNMHVADEEGESFARGFKSAADKVYDAVCDYIVARGFDKRKIKIWITGFSRGAAVSNLLGARLTRDGEIKKDNIFVYTFATPFTVLDRAWFFTDNIFNIVSEIDSVPRVPLGSWGFMRYGTDLYLPCKTRRGEERFLQLQSAMINALGGITTQLGLEGFEYAAYPEQELALDLLFDYLDDLVSSPERYREGGYQDILMDYMKSKYCGGSFEPKTFLSFLLDGNTELAEDLGCLIENWNSLGALDKVQRIGRLPAKYKQGDLDGASQMLSMGLSIFARYAAKLTATKVTGGEQDYYYEQLVSMLVDCYHRGENSALLMQHWPEVYLAWLESGDEHTLYRTSPHEKQDIK